MRLLDLFCCAGGAATGYHRAGFDVVGVDIEHRGNYPFAFMQRDALTLEPDWIASFDAIHASPLCQFGLDIRRHRLFESNWPLVGTECNHAWQTPRFPPSTNRTNLRSTVEVGAYRCHTLAPAAMGIDWMTNGELSEAIPPHYTEFIGRQLMAFLRARTQMRPSAISAVRFRVESHPLPNP